MSARLTAVLDDYFKISLLDKQKSLFTIEFLMKKLYNLTNKKSLNFHKENHKKC